jgi:hypothetical protein
MDGLDHPGGQLGLAARAVLERAAARLLAFGVVAVLAALALFPDSDDEDADLASGQLVEPFLPETGIRWSRTTPSYP